MPNCSLTLCTIIGDDNVITLYRRQLKPIREDVQHIYIYAYIFESVCYIYIGHKDRFIFFLQIYLSHAQTHVLTHSV